MSRSERLREVVRDRVAGRVASASGLADVAALESQVDSLEVAVAENAALAEPLAGLVDRLEHDVAEVVARRGGDGMGA